MKRFLYFSLLFCLALDLAACGSFSLAEDISPPPNYTPAVARPSQMALNGPVYPLVPPRPLDGQQIYEEKCAACHGAEGLGNGPRASQLPNPPVAIGTPELMRLAAPARWYQIITQGNLEKSMPPFSGLSDRQRWDVLAYVYSLGIRADQVAMGKTLFAQNCKRCHGDNGQGGGPELATRSMPLKDLTDQAAMSEKSAADIYKIISAGMGSDMPAYQGKLSDAELWILSDYVRWLTFEAPGKTLTDATQTVVSTTAHTLTATAGLSTTAMTSRSAPDFSGEFAGTITGTVMNALGKNLSASLEISLRGFDQMQEVISRTTHLKPEGTFVFENVPMRPGRYFMATTRYQDISYNSNTKPVEGDQFTLHLPIHVYETTSDVTKLSVDRLHLFFEALDAKTLRVVEIYIISNAGDKTVVPLADGNPVVQFKVPAQATHLEFRDSKLGERYLPLPDGFGDTMPVQPGSGIYQMFYMYELPFDGRLDLEKVMSLPVGAVVILVPEGTLQIKGDRILDGGLRTVQDGRFQMYNGTNLASGEVLKLSLSGSVQGNRVWFPVGDSSNLMIGLAALGVVLVAAGIWVYRRGQPAGDVLDPGGLASMEGPVENVEALMDAILALDDLYKAGQLPEEAYQTRRAELKARLQQAMTG